MSCILESPSKWQTEGAWSLRQGNNRSFSKHDFIEKTPEILHFGCGSKIKGLFRGCVFSFPCLWFRRERKTVAMKFHRLPGSGCHPKKRSSWILSSVLLSNFCFIQSVKNKGDAFNLPSVRSSWGSAVPMGQA